MRHKWESDPTSNHGHRCSQCGGYRLRRPMGGQWHLEYRLPDGSYQMDKAPPCNPAVVAEATV